MKLPTDFELLKPPLGQYQIDTIGYGTLNPCAGLLLGLGTGKTYCAINIARYRIQHDNVERVLVCCPNSIIYNWCDQVHLFSEYEAEPLIGHRKDRIHKIETSNKQFFIINYEMLHPMLPDLLEGCFEMMIFDESARFIKTYGAKRTKAAIALGQSVNFNLILTGTLFGNHPKNMWTQFKALDGGVTFPEGYYHWLNKYFRKIDQGRYYEYHITPASIKTFRSKIAQSCIQISTEEAIELPDSFYNTIKLSYNSVRHYYEPVREQIIAEVSTQDGGIIVNTKSIFTKLIRLQQITSGFVASKKDKSSTKYDKISWVHEPAKLEALLNEIESILYENEACVVWCRFLPSIEMISKRLKKLNIKHLTMQGSDGPKKYLKWKEYQKNDTIPVIIGQIMSTGIGTELFKIDGDPEKTQHALYYENVWDLDAREQSERRTLRKGQNSKCRYVDFTVTNTIDEKIMQSIVQKTHLKDQILGKHISEII